MIGSQIARDQLIGAVTAGAGAPATLAKRVFDFENEKRSASMVELPFAAAPAPPSPTEADLCRWYDNHPDAFRVPEFRKIKAIVLTPETIAKNLTFSDAELRQWFDAHKSAFSVPAKRAVQVLVAPDEAKAKALAAQWSGGADWATMQKAAEAAGGSAVDLPEGTEQAIPEPDLAKAAFAAQPGEVVGPVKTTLGFDVLKATKAEPGHEESFDQAKDQVRQRAAAEQAGSLIYDRVNKVDNILGTGAGLDKLPTDLGLVGIQGTLDAKGDTQGRHARTHPWSARIAPGDRDRRLRRAKGRGAVGAYRGAVAGRGVRVLWADRAGCTSPYGQTVRAGEGSSEHRVDQSAAAKRAGKSRRAGSVRRQGR